MTVDLTASQKEGEPLTVTPITVIQDGVGLWQHSELPLNQPPLGPVEVP